VLLKSAAWFLLKAIKGFFGKNQENPSKMARGLQKSWIVFELFDVQTLNQGELLVMSDKQLSEPMCLQDVAMNLLATGYSLEEVAEVLGVTVNAIYCWRRRDPSFRPIVKSLRKQIKQKERGNCRFATMEREGS
jgi:hypothetical protein